MKTGALLQKNRKKSERNTNPVAQINYKRPERINRRLYSRITAPMRGYFQIDLLDISQFKYWNDNVNYLIVIIDIYSRYAWCLPLKKKTKGEVVEILESWVKAMEIHLNKRKGKMRAITFDQGSEFINHFVRDMLDENEVRVYYDKAGQHFRTYMVERLNKTLRGMIQTFMALNNTKRYIDDLPDIVKHYNTSVHSTIKEKPEDVWYFRKEPKPVKTPSIVTDIVPGDKVRIAVYQDKIKAKGNQHWSDRIYAVWATFQNKALLDDNNTYSYHQLLKIPKETPALTHNKEEQQIRRAERFLKKELGP